jgi:hypothetical protein
VDDKPESGGSRREEIGQRLAAIRTRIDELKPAVQQDDASPTAVSERIGSAQRQAAASQVAAEHAIAASIRAFRRSADPTSRPPSSVNEPRQPGSVIKTSTSGKQHAIGQPPRWTHNERNAPDRCLGTKRLRMLADRTRYYGAFYRSALLPLLRRINAYLMRWLRKKYKWLASKKKARACWERVTAQYPRLFAHWAWVPYSWWTG